MKRIISVLLAVLCLLSVISVSMTSLAADESDYKADFTISASKLRDIEKDDTIVISVKLKTNYAIYVLGLPVVYDATKFDLLDANNNNLKSFLTFYGEMSEKYVTNGNWKSPSELYTRRNSNTAYWSQSSVMNKYKILNATWTADSRLSNVPVTLWTDTTIVSFKLKAKSAIATLAESDVFISEDFKKTASFAGGVWYVGRCAGHVSDASFVPVGQTLTAKSDFKSYGQGEVVNETIDLQYKSTLDLAEYRHLENFDFSKCSIIVSDSNVLRLNGTKITGIKQGKATVFVSQANMNNKAVLNVNVEYAWWQWIIIIVFFGWIWYK